MFENTYKKIDNLLRNDAGCSSALDYIEQSSWLLFLKYFDDTETENLKAAEFSGKEYRSILDEKFRWSSWAAPKKEDKSIDRDIAKRGADLIEFVNQELFPYLAQLKYRSNDVTSIEYKIGEIFGDIKNKINEGNTMRNIIEQIDQLSFNSNQAKHDISVLYENGLAQMGNAGRNGGEYYTPRPIIKIMVKAINPQIGEKVYDGAVGSAGFLVEAFEYLNNPKLTNRQITMLKENTLYGQEKKGLSFMNGIMNMILHGVKNPNIKRGNSLEENVMQFQSKDKVDVVLANPPFGGSEDTRVRRNFEIQNSGETAYLFLQHFVKKLNTTGRAAIIIKNTFLSNDDAEKLRAWLLNECKIETILNLPDRAFTHAGVKTVILFLSKGKSKAEDKIWYYEPKIDRKLGKTSPIQEDDLSGFIDFYANKKKGSNAWFVKVKDINQKPFDLSVVNPIATKKKEIRDPARIIKDIQENYKVIEKSINTLSKIAT